jgi:hypothetical protein
MGSSDRIADFPHFNVTAYYAAQRLGAFTPPNLSPIRGRNGETDPDLFR